MITLETSIKIGKSPKKPPMEVSEDESGTDSGSEEIYSKDNEANMESAHEGLVENADQKVFIFGTEDNKSNTDQEEHCDVFSLNNINKTIANPGWADAMRKVLSNKKPKRKKSIVLSKAKKHCNIGLDEKKETLSFEIEDPNDNVTKETVVIKQSVNEKGNGDKKRKKKELKTGIRVKPSILDRERERILQKIATKGVLQLFNAVRHQQVEIGKKLGEAGSLERKREKVLKDIDKKVFLDVLMGGTKSIKVNDTINELTMQNETSSERKNVWKILRDDFIMGASLKDWDKKIPEEENSSIPEEIDSDE